MSDAGQFYTNRVLKEWKERYFYRFKLKIFRNNINILIDFKRVYSGIYDIFCCVSYAQFKLTSIKVIIV